LLTKEKLTMDYRRAYAWHISVCKKRHMKKRKHKRSEKHHILPVCLGGEHAGTVRMSKLNHTYAHLLLPLALLDDGRVEDAKRLVNARPYLSGYFVLLSRRAMRLTKVHAWLPDGTSAVMTLKSASKMYCKRTNRDWKNPDAVGKMAFHLLYCIVTGKPYFERVLSLAA